MTTAWSRVRMAGPLAPYAERFGRELVAKGYTELSTAEQLRLMAHLSRWMSEQGLEPAMLGSEHIVEYCESRRAQGYTARLAPSAVGCLRDFLRRQEVLPAPPVELPASAEGQLLARYEHYLAHERGLVERVVAAWVKAAAVFLAQHPGLASGGTPIGPAEVIAFCSRELPRRSSSPARNLAAALRSFLRFLHVEGGPPCVERHSG